MTIEITPEAMTRERWLATQGTPPDAIPTDVRTAARDRLAQRVRIFENLDKSSSRRSELADEISSNALDALADELYASRGIPVSDHLSIIDALSRVATATDAELRQRASRKVTEWLSATPGSAIDDRGLVAANRLLALLEGTQPTIDVQRWKDVPRNGYPTSAMVGQLRAAVDVALSSRDPLTINSTLKSISSIATHCPRGWIGVDSEGQPLESPNYRSPIRVVLESEGARIRAWYMPQQLQIARVKRPDGAKTTSYQALEPTEKLLRQIIKNVQAMCEALDLPSPLERGSGAGAVPKKPAQARDKN